MSLTEKFFCEKNEKTVRERAGAFKTVAFSFWLCYNNKKEKFDAREKRVLHKEKMLLFHQQVRIKICLMKLYLFKINLH